MAKRITLFYLGAAVLAVAAFMTLAGCAGTVRPGTAHAKTASWDGNEQNSGFLGFDPLTGNGVMTPHARERYNGLIASYGGRFTPALHQDAGLWPTGTNTFLIDAEHLADFARMNRWRRGAPER